MRRAAIAVFGWLALGAAPAHAGTIDVTTFTDGSVCDGATCTLRGALILASQNGATEDDLIRLPAGIYTVDAPLQASGTRITVAGAGANSTFIQPTESTRVLTVSSGASIGLRDVTLRNGVATDTGGNVLVQNTGALGLMRARLTNGTAPQGGGLTAQGANQITIVASLIDNNRTTGSSATTNVGGGIFASGSTSTMQLAVQDSTITRNSAVGGGGMYVQVNVATSLRGVTLARNTARTFGNTGGIFSSGSGGVRFQGSIVAANTMAGPVFGGGTGTPQPSNCGISPPPIDEGGNVESEATCGLGGLTNTDPKLADLDDRQQPPVLAIAADSPARDFASCGTRTFDQRGVVRPQGLLCDAGAYEYVEPVVEAPPTPTPTPTAVPTPTTTAVPTPTPTVNRTIVVAPTEGTVRVKRKGSSKYEPLDVTKGIPVGSTLDTRKGRVRLTSIPKTGAPPESAWFWDGIFRVTQSRGITNLTLTEQLAKCPKKGRASAAARKAKKRKLWGDGKGSFRTTGKYSAATVRGTKWLVEDSCSGTLTRVTQGSVRVKAGKVTRIVRAGKRYLARPRR